MNKNIFNENSGLKYPVLLVHGMGFRDDERYNYWGRIPGELEKIGCKIFYGNQDSNGSVKTNGEFIANRIDEILAITGAKKLNIIAHSKGGLDCRYAISTLGLGDKVATLTTISTPHHGSKTVDLLLKFPDIIVKFIGKCTDLVFKLQGDENPNSYEIFHSFTTRKSKEFNINNPDAEGVYYQSFAFTMKHFYSDLFLWFPNLIIKIIEGENDGLLTPDSAKWGDFKGVFTGNGYRGISHCDEVDLRRRKLTKRTGNGISDIVDFYKYIVTDLTQKGY